MLANNEEHASQLLRQLLEATGNLEQALELLVVEHGIPKRIAEALACGLGTLPKRYESNKGTLGPMGQKRLLHAKVLVAGLGGLGGYVVEQLARCGTGTMIGVDADHFDETNLNRQLLADRNSVGLNKAEVAEKRVNAVNDAVEFQPHCCRVEDLGEKDYSGVHLLYDCLDQIATKLYLQDMGERYDIPVVHGAIGGWYGQVAVVWPGSRLLQTLYGTKREGIERALGNPPFTPALIASLMVTEGIKVLLGKENKRDGIFFVDLLNNQWEYVSL
jgi:molybdopterin/thiamine biosynthesis adenylyltransferase